MLNAPTAINARQSMMFVYAIIITCACAYLFIPEKDPLYDRMALSGNGLQAGYYEQLVTSMFMHGGFMHIFFNMYGLYLFGSMIAPFIKLHNFILLYFISGILGSVCFVLTSDPNVGCVGASGAVCGVAIAAAMINPDVRIMLLFAPFPIKMKSFAWVYIGISVLFAITGTGDNIAHLAHLGGFIGGFIYLRIIGLYAWDPIGFLFKSRKNTYDDWNTYEGTPSPRSASSADDRNEEFSPAEIDRLLEKIADHGINSLSPEEYDLLRRARNQFKRQ